MILSQGFVYKLWSYSYTNIDSFCKRLRIPNLSWIQKSAKEIILIGLLTYILFYY